jgi:hypothetical protein
MLCVLDAHKNRLVQLESFGPYQHAYSARSIVLTCQSLCLVKDQLLEVEMRVLQTVPRQDTNVRLPVDHLLPDTLGWMPLCTVLP